MTLEVLGGLLRDADRLGDETLARAVAVYQEQLVLVLAQQAGPVSGVATAAAPKSEPETTALPTQSEPVREGSGGRRRR